LNTQEEERQRIARGLHDEVGQTYGRAAPAQAPRTRSDAGPTRCTQGSASGG
jgi:glucose-6-phosphate-specific signal transduction histidine kinase